jgi:2-dehydropantoate 2-reductase
MMRICVFGAGAVGGYLAARLAHAGRDVSVVARGAQLQAIRERGLTLTTPTETITARPRASDAPRDLGIHDLVIVAVKTPALAEVAAAMKPLLGPETLVAFAVNGVYWFYGHGFAPNGGTVPGERLDPGGVIEREIGAARSLGIIVYSPNVVVAPGVVRNGGDSSFTIGEALAGATEKAERVAAAMAGCGFETKVTGDIRRAMWRKLVDNVGNSPLAVLAGASIGAISAEPAAHELVLALRRETMAVAAAQGFPDLGIVDTARRQGAGAVRTSHKPSILQDLERGRPMEIDAQLVAVQELARRGGVATPVLDTLLPLVILRARLAGCYGEKIA